MGVGLFPALPLVPAEAYVTRVEGAGDLVTVGEPFQLASPELALKSRPQQDPSLLEGLGLCLEGAGCDTSAAPGLPLCRVGVMTPASRAPCRSSVHRALVWPAHPLSPSAGGRLLCGLRVFPRRRPASDGQRRRPGPPILLPHGQQSADAVWARTGLCRHHLPPHAALCPCHLLLGG